MVLLNLCSEGMLVTWLIALVVAFHSTNDNDIGDSLSHFIWQENVRSFYGCVNVVIYVCVWYDLFKSVFWNDINKTFNDGVH